MLKRNLKPHRKVMAGKKAKRVEALAFFLCMAIAQSLFADSTNWVDGTAYGTNYADLATADSISSIANGNGSLAIGYSGTTNLTVSHTISGTITVSNNFDHFSIDATGGKVSGSNFAVLTVLGGTNLTITGGQFLGTAGSAGIVLPPIPGQGSQTNSVSSAAMGGIIYNTTNVQISGTTFAGTTYQPDNSTSYGTDGLRVIDSQDVTITNGTLKGGAGQAASSESLGGRALYVENSDVTITNGTYTGGGAGTAQTSAGGAALYAKDASIEISGNATFTGGKNAAALYVRNSDVTVNGGTFQGGSYSTTNNYFGLVGFTDASKTNNISLNGGTFNSIDFDGDGTQFFTAGTDLSVSKYIVVDGGTVVVDNQSNDALQDLRIRDGSMSFRNDVTLSSDGSLALYSDSSMASFPSLSVASNATAWVGTGKINVDNNFSLSKGGMLSFSIITNHYGELTADTASFQTNSTIQIDATQAAFTYGTNDVTLVSTATSNSIYVLNSDGTTNSTTGSNIDGQVTINAYTADRTILSDILSNGGSNLVFRFTTQTLRDYWNATGQFGDFADEIKNNTQMALLVDQYHSASLSAQAVEQTYFTTFNNFQTALQGMQATVGESVSRGSEFREQLKLIPAGARGPERKNDVRGWIKYYGEYFTHDRDGLNPSYDTILHGGAVGIDKSFGNLLLGVSGGSSHYRMDYGQKARANTVAYNGNIYGTLGTDRGYLDGGISYGQNQVDTRTAEPFTLEGSFDSQLASGYLGGGYDLIDTQGGTVFTPEASIQYSKYRQDAYTETSDVAIPRVIDKFDADSLLSSVGMNISMLNMTALETFGFKVDGRLHWMHEFNPDPSNMNFTLEGGSNTYQLAYPSLDQDIYRLGIGCSFFNTLPHRPRNVMFRLDFDELFGNGFNSHNLSAKLVYAF